MDKWKINCGRFQVGLGFIALIVTVIGIHSFIPLEKVIFDNLHLEQIDILLGLIIFVFGVLTSSVIVFTGFINIAKGEIGK